MAPSLNRFGSFPERVTHLLSNETTSSVQTQVESTVYPAYDTRGELVTAVANHHKWLTELVRDRSKVFRQEKGEDGVVRVVLIGHSMVSELGVGFRGFGTSAEVC